MPAAACVAGRSSGGCAAVQTRSSELGRLDDRRGSRPGCRPGQGACGMPMSLHAAVDIAGVHPSNPASHRRATDTTEGSDMKTTHTPDPLTQASLAEIASFQGRPCLSLYQPTHRRHPDNQQDPIRFRHLVKALETSLRQQHAADAVKALLEPFEALAQDHDFWNHTLDGLAVLGAPGLFRVFLLQRHGGRAGRGGRQLPHQAAAPVPAVDRALPGAGAEPAQGAALRRRSQRARCRGAGGRRAADDDRGTGRRAHRAAHHRVFAWRHRRRPRAHAPWPGRQERRDRRRRRTLLPRGGPCRAGTPLAPVRPALDAGGLARTPPPVPRGQPQPVPDGQRPDGRPPGPDAGRAAAARLGRGSAAAAGAAGSMERCLRGRRGQGAGQRGPVAGRPCRSGRPRGHVADRGRAPGGRPDRRHRPGASIPQNSTTRAWTTCSTTWVRWSKRWAARSTFCRPSACLPVPAWRRAFVTDTACVPRPHRRSP